MLSFIVLKFILKVISLLLRSLKTILRRLLLSLLLWISNPVLFLTVLTISVITLALWPTIIHLKILLVGVKLLHFSHSSELLSRPGLLTVLTLLWLSLLVHFFLKVYLLLLRLRLTLTELSNFSSSWWSWFPSYIHPCGGVSITNSLSNFISYLLPLHLSLIKLLISWVISLILILVRPSPFRPFLWLIIHPSPLWLQLRVSRKKTLRLPCWRVNSIELPYILLQGILLLNISLLLAELSVVCPSFLTTCPFCWTSHLFSSLKFWVIAILKEVLFSPHGSRSFLGHLSYRGFTNLSWYASNYLLSGFSLHFYIYILGIILNFSWNFIYFQYF